MQTHQRIHLPIKIADGGQIDELAYESSLNKFVFKNALVCPRGVKIEVTTKYEILHKIFHFPPDELTLHRMCSEYHTAYQIP